MDPKKSLKKISEFFEEKRRMPSYREIADLVGFKSKNAAVKLVQKLLETGFLEKDRGGKLLPGPLMTGIPLLGTVEAGFPSAAEEELIDTMNLDDFLIEKKEATFMLTVSGDSMIEAGILPGDMVLAERGGHPHEGDIVIAEVDQGWTMKYFHTKGGKVVLLPGNSKYSPIVPKEELKIAAIVKGVIRKYQ